MCIFSKHMAQFGYDDLAKNAKQIGFDGMDLTVRDKGSRGAGECRDRYASRGGGDSVAGAVGSDDHDRPAPCRRGTSRPTSVHGRRTEDSVLETGLLPLHKLDTAGAVEKTLAEVRPQIAGLVALSKSTGLRAGFTIIPEIMSGLRFGTRVS